MAESPDELLIFKLREPKSPQTNQSTTTKPATKEEPKPQPKAEPMLTSKPLLILPPPHQAEAAKPSEEIKSPTKGSPFSFMNRESKQQAKPSPEIQKAKVEIPAPPQVALKEAKPKEISNQQPKAAPWAFMHKPTKPKVSSEVQMAKVEAPPPSKPMPSQPKQEQAPAPQQPIAQETDTRFPDPRNYYVPKESDRSVSAFNASYNKRLIVKNKSQSRAAAKGFFCSWHPWRQAYAICSYCHRPFCYEDAIEYKNGYYCIEDIDSVEKDYVTVQRSEYNTTSLISTGLMLLAFIVFIYYAGAQMIYIFQYAWQLGFLPFLAALKLSYIFALSALAIMVLSLCVAMYSFSASRRANILGVMVGILSVTFFTYLFITTGTDYLAVMAFLEFLSFMGSVYSAASAVKVYDQPEARSDAYDMTFWPNVSKF